MLKGKNPRSYAFTPPITTLLIKPRVQLAQCAFSLGFSISFSSSTSEDAMQETQVRSLGREDPLEKRMATHSSILAWSIPWTEEPGGPQSMGSQRVRHNWATNPTTISTSEIAQMSFEYDRNMSRREPGISSWYILNPESPFSGPAQVLAQRWHPPSTELNQGGLDLLYHTL